MCGSSLCPDTPQSTTTLVVTYCYEKRRWHAQVCSHSIDGEGDILQHGSAVREFGPFDGSGDVLQWVYGEARSLIRLMAVRDNLDPQVPPQGNDSGRP